MEISCAFRSNFRPEPRNFAVLQIIGNLNFRSEFLEFSFRTNYRLFSAKFIEIRRISFALLLHSTVTYMTTRILILTYKVTIALAPGF